MPLLDLSLQAVAGSLAATPPEEKGSPSNLPPQMKANYSPIKLLSQSFRNAFPRWREPRGKSKVNLPQMPPDSGSICTGVDQKTHLFAPGLPPGREVYRSIHVCNLHHAHSAVVQTTRCRAEQNTLGKTGQIHSIQA